MEKIEIFSNLWKARHYVERLVASILDRLIFWRISDYLFSLALLVRSEVQNFSASWVLDLAKCSPVTLSLYMLFTSVDISSSFSQFAMLSFIFRISFDAIYKYRKQAYDVKKTILQ